MFLSDGIQCELPLDRGSYVVVTLLCHRDENGWKVRFLHRHSGERAMCPSISTYEGLSVTEMTQVIDDVLSASNGRFQLSGGTCSPV